MIGRRFADAIARIHRTSDDRLEAFPRVTDDAAYLPPEPIIHSVGVAALHRFQLLHGGPVLGLSGEIFPSRHCGSRPLVI